MRLSHVVTAGVVFIAAFLFRLSTVSLTNDDYLHLSLAQQLLLGEVPVRDFIDPGEYLFNYVSAAVQVLFGRNLLSEVTLDALMLAAGYTLVFALARHASRSWLVGIFATTIAVLLMPRLYSYPKIVLFAVALSLMWGYIGARDTRRLLMLVGWTAMTFLFRHDYGANIGAASCAMLAITHWHDGWRAAAGKVLRFGAATALLLLPFFVFLQVNGGIVTYWRNTLATGRAEYQRTVGVYPPFRPALVAPRISVRWAPGVDEPVRRALEERFHLAAAEERDGGWLYDLMDASRANITALIRDPAVADTGGLDRVRFTVAVRVIEPNALAWLYYLTRLLPLLAIGMLLWTARDGSRPVMEYEREKIASAAVLAALMHVFLLRAASESAVADVSTLTAVLGAWTLRRGVVPWRAGARPLARAVPAPARAVPALAVFAATLAVLTGTLAATSRAEGTFVFQRLVATLEDHGTDPVAGLLDGLRLSSPPFANEGAKYVFSCTEDSDRLLVTGYAPDVYYQSGRGFAAGRPYFLYSFAPLPEAERFSLDRLMKQRVPIVLADEGGEPDFAAAPSISRHVREHYRRAGEIQFRYSTFAVLVDDRIPPACSYGSQRLPCFRPCAGVVP